MFTFQSCRKLMGANWPTLRKHMLKNRFPEGIYTCEICGESYNLPQFVEMHEIYEAEYNTYTKHFTSKVINLQFLCKSCHLVKHRDYLATLAENQQREIIQHIANVNGISYEEADSMPATSVPQIKIVGGKDGERFYFNYNPRDVEGYNMEFDVEIDDKQQKDKIATTLSNIQWIKADECLEVDGKWYIGPTAVNVNQKIKTKLPFHINRKKLRNKRKEIGYSGRELAEKLGVSYNTYLSWESKNRNPSCENFEKLKEALMCSREELI